MLLPVRECAVHSGNIKRQHRWWESNECNDRSAGATSGEVVAKTVMKCNGGVEMGCDMLLWLDKWMQLNTRHGKNIGK